MRLWLLLLCGLFAGCTAAGTLSHQVEDLQVDLLVEPDPPKVGEVTVKSVITRHSPAGESTSVTDAKIEFAYFRFPDGKPEGNVKTVEGKLEGQAYTGRISLDSAGAWKVVVKVTRAEEGPVTAAFQLTAQP